MLKRPFKCAADVEAHLAWFPNSASLAHRCTRAAAAKVCGGGRMREAVYSDVWSAAISACDALAGLLLLQVRLDVYRLRWEACNCARRSSVANALPYLVEASRPCRPD